ncbi:tetratricopeptide repeat protein [Lutibacter sp. Hel_I_33_5]|uniref:SPOR domain-containing protein n=1 Tax=Lutibacter sp. Hel_I_33_5 TaxID=1566289 RepID=UPI0011A09F40|nr:SPOR domain-containing protein [Lutibacter sp. Hel_I_33_5]TVZ55471.1 tetratricopeptide repeat protein [Lutibacter sp. Hel_I_33_5]
MKILKKTKSIYQLLFLVSISLILASCSSKDKKAYKKEVVIADSLFKNNEFEIAKIYYENALKVNKSDSHAKNQLLKAEELIAIKQNNKYDDLIKQADTLLENKEYEKAKKIYLEASKIKSNENNLTEKINSITKILDIKNSKPYHVIVGSYEIESNAYALQRKLKKQNTESTVFKSHQNNHLVSIKSFNTLNQAYNHLYQMEEEYDFNPETWVYKMK